MRVCIAQMNPTVGALDHNTNALCQAYLEGVQSKADLVVAPELALCGYPPRDLLDRPSFIQACMQAASKLAAHTGATPFIVGSVVAQDGDPLVSGGPISNGALLLQNGRVQACHRKILLPTYDVFDEARYFMPGTEATIIEVANHRIGLSVCEDAWNDKDYWRTPRYSRDPMREQIHSGADLLVNISASPYDRDKPSQRLEMLQARASRCNRHVIYANQVGGNDSLLFDGRSAVLKATGALQWLAPSFVQHIHTVDLNSGDPLSTPNIPWPADVVDALCMGIADYLRKCGAHHVVLGLSGGIDSALTAALAVRALGPERVRGVTMPSRYSSQGAADDAIELGKRLGITVDTVPIEPMFAAFLRALTPAFQGRAPDVTEENLQARIRGTILMAYSNKLGAILLSTGNKSELAVGYSTLYGDMCGGLAVISDLYKTEVYQVSHYINSVMQNAIPEGTLTKPPSAELRPDQKDEDSLPPYELLDAVLRDYIEGHVDHQGLLDLGHDKDLVQRILTLTDKAEYKRRQMPPGLRVSRKAFGEGRRLPIARGSDPNCWDHSM